MSEEVQNPEGPNSPQEQVPNLQGEPNTPKELEQILQEGEIEKMPYQSALGLAVGGKQAYFSAHNPGAVVNRKGVCSGGQGTYFCVDDDQLHYVEGLVLHPETKGEDIAKGAWKRNLIKDLRLPIVFKKRNETVKISDITEEQAKEAGYMKRPLQFLLAAQSDKKADFRQAVIQKLPPILAQLVVAAPPAPGVTPPTEEQLMAMRNLLGTLVLHQMQLGEGHIPSEALNSGAMQSVPLVMAHLAYSFEDQEIPGEAEIYNMRVAKPEEIVACDKVETEEEARKKLGDALGKLYHPMDRRLVGPNPKTRALFEEMSDIYATKGNDNRFTEMLGGLEKKIGDLLTPSSGQKQGGEKLWDKTPQQRLKNAERAVAEEAERLRSWQHQEDERRAGDPEEERGK